MREISTRKITRAINMHYPDQPYRCVRKEVIKDHMTWLFVNIKNHMIGIVDWGDHLSLHDRNNPNDTLAKPTLLLSKGKKVKPLL